MAKLYFRYGAMGSAKTLNLLAVAHNYEQQHKRVILMKPALDTRFGPETIASRAGLKKKADILVDADTDILQFDFSGVACVLVDEAQFISAEFIDQLRVLTLEQDVPVICYGLRTDFKSKLFDGSKRLMEVADAIEEVKSTCYYCNRKSLMNLKFVDGIAVSEGPSIELGAEEKYLPACFDCYRTKIAEGAEQRQLLTQSVQ
jgi:thymidine kinase